MKGADIDFVPHLHRPEWRQELAQELERRGMDDVHMLLPSGDNEGFIAVSGGLFQRDETRPPFRPYRAEPEPAALR